MADSNPIDPDNPIDSENPVDEAELLAQAEAAKARIERDSALNHNRRLGLAMVVSLVVGYPAMLDAATGVGPLADALVRYLVVLAACVAAAMLIGYLLDSAERSELANGEPSD